MLILLSPSKTMGGKIKAGLRTSTPRYLQETQELLTILKRMSVEELSQFMSISPKLAIQNYERYAAFDLNFTHKNSIPAIYAFTGELYSGLSTDDFNTKDLTYAQNHIRILSGLYGSLRPLDLIKEYRLEMGSRLKTYKGSNLYHYWGDIITQSIHDDVRSTDGDIIINLASDEYFKVINLKNLSVPVIHFDFFEIRNGKKTFVSFSAKRARGLMAQYIIKNRISKPAALVKFDMEGYRFDEESSSTQHLVFVKY